MKRFVLCVLLAALCLVSCAAWAEPLGFGVVNAADVALRREPGGKVIVRLPEDTCVWINDSRTDGSGVLWYEVRSGLHVDNANYDFSGWMMAAFIDAGDALWHDVTAIAARNHGLIALRADGSTVTAGRPIVAMDGSDWVSPFGWADLFGRAIHVGVPVSGGNEYFIVTEGGTFVSSVNGVHFANGMTKAEALETAEEIISGKGFPAWSSGPEVTAFRSAGASDPDGTLPIELYTAVLLDGSVVAEPELLAELLSGWTDVIDIRLTSSYVLGLKRDGTVLSAAFGEDDPPDVTGWRDVVAIGAGSDWCVGLKSDGTLVFAGDHVFMGEGHVRR